MRLPLARADRCAGGPGASPSAKPEEGSSIPAQHAGSRHAKAVAFAEPFRAAQGCDTWTDVSSSTLQNPRTGATGWLPLKWIKGVQWWVVEGPGQAERLNEGALQVIEGSHSVGERSIVDWVNFPPLLRECGDFRQEDSICWDRPGAIGDQNINGIVSQ